VKRLVQVALGILTAIGGFVDIGDLVANAETGARFGLSLAWVVIVGVVGIVVYAEMAGRVAAVSQRAVFDVIRERLGARVALVNLGASFFINFLTVMAEIAGVALSLQLATSVNYLLWIPLVAFLVWLVIWRMKFSQLENLFGLLGLALVVMAVALWQLHPDWGGLAGNVLRPHKPATESWAAYWYFGIALLGAAMTPYEVFFFSSGAIEEGWTTKDLMTSRLNVFIGFPLGGLLSLSLMGLTAVVFAPHDITVDHLGQVALPTSLALGRLGLSILLVGFFAATFGAALETGLSAGYSVSQYFGWQWGKRVAPRQAPRFHLVVLVTIVVATLLGLTAVDPIKVTEYSIVLAAAALPLTYFPILVVANDREFMKDKRNSPFVNAVALVYLVLLVIISIATIPLMVLTKAGS
jgi:Mn2+/Fe2+ NRAMP family transporter